MELHFRHAWRFLHLERKGRRPCTLDSLNTLRYSNTKDIQNNLATMHSTLGEPLKNNHVVSASFINCCKKWLHCQFSTQCLHALLPSKRLQGLYRAERHRARTSSHNSQTSTLLTDTFRSSSNTINQTLLSQKWPIPSPFSHFPLSHIINSRLTSTLTSGTNMSNPSSSTRPYYQTPTSSYASTGEDSISQCGAGRSFYF